MKFVELNPKGAFDDWEPTKLLELQEKSIGTSIGDQLLYEDSQVKIWDISLQPKERLPFRRIKGNFSFNCITGGMVISRYKSGKIMLTLFQKVDSLYRGSEEPELVVDLENIGDTSVKITIIEHKSSLIL